MTKSRLIILCCLLAAAIVFPFLAGYWLSGADHQFGGFLLNPYDGNSYLAKMRLGWQGEWRFQLPYTAEQGKGAYLFLFYILLGHLARITNLSLPFVFHLARLLSAVFLIYALLRFLRKTLLPDDSGALGWITTLLLFGSGLGWIAGLFGGFTSDFWVAEAFPFLSMYANPHFPLGLGFLLLFFDSLINGLKLKKALWLLPMGVVTAIVQPFAVVIGAVVAALYVFWISLENKRLAFPPALIFVIGGGIFLIYQYSAILSDPLLSGWNAQNVTPSPPLWDTIISFSPGLILAILMIVFLFRRTQAGQYKLLVIWLIAGLLLVYIPFPLQRRFLLGFYIPCAALAGIGLERLVTGKAASQRRIKGGLILLSVITNLFVILSGISGILNREPLLYISKDERSAFEWMSKSQDEPGLILASEQSGMFIPANTGWRVIYGHPFETVDAHQRQNEIHGIFGGWDQVQISSYVVKNQVEFVFWGPREQMRRKDNPFLEYPIAYQNETVAIFETGEGR